MTSHIFMFLFFTLMGIMAFGVPFMIVIPEQKETYLSFFQVGTLVCTTLSALNAFDDLKRLISIQRKSA